MAARRLRSSGTLTCSRIDLHTTYDIMTSSLPVFKFKITHAHSMYDPDSYRHEDVSQPELHCRMKTLLYSCLYKHPAVFRRRKTAGSLHTTPAAIPSSVLDSLVRREPATLEEYTDRGLRSLPDGFGEREAFHCRGHTKLGWRSQ